MTTISIAMATYNGATFIQEQLDSLASQTILPMELIITDDGSTDGTLQIVADFAERAPFLVEVHRNAERLGYAANFMRCANLCRGDLVAFCDQDDIWLPTKLELCADAIKNDDVYMIYHNALKFTKENTVLDLLYHDKGDFGPTTSLSRPFSFCALGFTIVFKTSLLAFTDLWRDSLDCSIDYGAHHKQMTHDQWISFIGNICGQIPYLPNTLAMYRRHENSVSLNNDGSLKRLASNIVRSEVRAYNSYKIYSKLADLLISSQTHNSGHLGANLRVASERLRNLGRWSKVRSDLCRETNVLERIAKIKTLVRENAYRSKYRGGLGLDIFIKDITVGLLLGGSKLMAKQ